MPSFNVIPWSAVEAGMTIIDRAGQPRLILNIQRYYDADDQWVEATDSAGTYRISYDHPAMVMEVSQIEAVVNVLVAFAGSEIIE